MTDHAIGYIHQSLAMTWLFALAIGLVAAAALLLWAGRGLRAAAGLPAGDLLYSDTGLHETLEAPLVSRRHGLVGRPDYLVHQTRRGAKAIVPVEVKSGRTPTQPHPGHALQLGAYCLLVEEVYGVTPSHGLLRYADGTRPVPFTPELRRAVLQAAAEIRRARSAADVPRQHNAPERCARCGYRSACTQALK